MKKQKLETLTNRRIKGNDVFGNILLYITTLTSFI